MNKKDLEQICNYLRAYLVQNITRLEKHDVLKLQSIIKTLKIEADFYEDILDNRLAYLYDNNVELTDYIGGE